MRYQCSVVSLFVVLLITPLFGQSNAEAEQLFERGMNAFKGAGVSRNALTAVDLIRRSADMGYSPAEVMMGYFYDTGTVVVSEPGQAAMWYRKASERDDRLAEWLLGRLYYSGSGVARDLDGAAGYFKKAGDQGDAFGEYFLGMIEVERHNYANAVTLLRKASAQGLPQAQWELGSLIRDGLGTKPDKFEAYVWLLISFDAGVTAVGGDLAALESELSPSQLEQAKSKARELERTVARSVAARGCTGWDGEFSAIPTPPPPDVQRFCR